MWFFLFLFKDVSSFPVLRLFIPGLDTERDSYGIKTKTLGNLFVKALAINSNSEDGKKLTLKTVTGDDYGTVVYNVMKDRSPQRSTLMVYEVDHYLELIANHFKDNQRSSKYFNRFNEMCSSEIWLIFFHRNWNENGENAQWIVCDGSQMAYTNNFEKIESRIGTKDDA